MPSFNLTIPPPRVCLAPPFAQGRLFCAIPLSCDIISEGENDMIYGRKGQLMKRMKPFSVDVKSTLGAGDTFKAGCVYGLLHGMEDDELVRFASACSAIAISRFPLPLNPPTLLEVNSLLENTKNK